MTMDFSQVNFEYLVQARDLAREDAPLTATLLDVPLEVTTRLASTKPSDLLHMSQIRAPLLVPRQRKWWWIRFLQAISDGNGTEISTVVDQASLLVVSEEPERAAK